MAKDVYHNGDMVLVKSGRSPYWPAVVKPCVVEEGDENHEFNGEYHRAPDWYWVLFFEDGAEPESGCWARASKIKSYGYKMTPVAAKDASLAEAHVHADNWVEKNNPDMVEKYNANLTANGAGVPNGDPGSTITIPPDVRRSSRPRKTVTSGEANINNTNPKVPKKRPANIKRQRVGNAPAQKRPRRVKASELDFDATMEMSIDELRKQNKALLKRALEAEKRLKEIQKISAGYGR